MTASTNKITNHIKYTDRLSLFHIYCNYPLLEMCLQNTMLQTIHLSIKMPKLKTLSVLIQFSFFFKLVMWTSSPISSPGFKALALTSFWDILLTGDCPIGLQCTSQTRVLRIGSVACFKLQPFDMKKETRGPWWSYIAHLSKQICILTIKVSATFTALRFLACLDEVQKELLHYPRNWFWRPHLR